MVLYAEVTLSYWLRTTLPLETIGGGLGTLISNLRYRFDGVVSATNAIEDSHFPVGLHLAPARE